MTKKNKYCALPGFTVNLSFGLVKNNSNIDMVVEAPALAELQLVSVFAHIPPPTHHPPPTHINLT